MSGRKRVRRRSAAWLKPIAVPHEEPEVHILTKVFAVFAAVLSLVLATLTMSMSFNTREVASALQSAEATAAAEKAQKDAEVNRAAEERSRLERQLQDLANENARQRGVNRDLETENARLRADVTREREAAQAIQTQIGDFDKTVAAQTRLIESFRAQNEDLRNESNRLRSESLALEDRLNDRESEQGVLEQTIRALEEQLAAAERARTGAATPSGTTPQAPFDFSGSVITTRVTSVARDQATGDTLIELAAGSNDRLAPNMRLYITRGNQWVADVVVIRADLNQAVARVNLISRGQTVQTGDTVLSRLR